MREGLILVEREITRAGKTFWRKQWVKPEERQPGDREVTDQNVIKKFLDEREKRKKYEEKFRAKKKANGTAKKPGDAPPPIPPPIAPPPKPPEKKPNEPEIPKGLDPYEAHLAALNRAPEQIRYNEAAMDEAKSGIILERLFEGMSTKDRAVLKDAAERLAAGGKGVGDMTAVASFFGRPQVLGAVNKMRSMIAEPGMEQPNVSEKARTKFGTDMALPDSQQNSWRDDFDELWRRGHDGAASIGEGYAEGLNVDKITVTFKAGTAGTWHSYERRINLDPAVAGKVVAAMSDPSPLKTGLDGYGQRRDAVRVLIHEVAHAASHPDHKYEGARDGAPHAALEEASTEWVAQLALGKLAHHLGIAVEGADHQSKRGTGSSARMSAEEALKTGRAFTEVETYTTKRNGTTTTRPRFRQVRGTSYTSFTQRFAGAVALAADAKNSAELTDAMERWSLAVKHVRGPMRYNRLADAIVSKHVSDRTHPAFGRARELVAGVLKTHMAYGQKKYEKTESRGEWDWSTGQRQKGKSYYKGSEVDYAGNDLLDEKVQKAIKAAFKKKG